MAALDPNTVIVCKEAGRFVQPGVNNLLLKARHHATHGRGAAVERELGISFVTIGSRFGPSVTILCRHENETNVVRALISHHTYLSLAKSDGWVRGTVQLFPYYSEQPNRGTDKHLSPGPFPKGLLKKEKNAKRPHGCSVWVQCYVLAASALFYHRIYALLCTH